QKGEPMFRVLRAAGLAALLTAMSLAAAPSAGAETRTADSRSADSRTADSHLTGAPPANGTRMCKQGHRTGLTCGIKLGTSGIWFTHLIWTNGGDSGAPVVVGSTLVGNAWGAQHSSSILDIIGELDANGGVGAGFHLVT
ncbi:hypothetical protein RND15_51015, partial [Streptomyces sp. DSM 41529]|nr:hypothetical protein [Streptomyces sp. DSM 41529]